MNLAAVNPRPNVVRVAVLAHDPQRRLLLTRILRELGHDVVSAVDDASVVLADGVAVRAPVPTVVLGLGGDDYRARLRRDASPEQIDAALRAVLAGLSVGMAEEPVRRFEALPDGEGRPLLSPREIEVLTAVSEGLTNKEIAGRLGISLHTVKFHLESLMRKLSVSTRAEAVSKSMRLNLLEPYRI